MPHDHDGHHEAAQQVPQPRRAPATTRNTDWRDRFGIPEPVKRVFGRFPLVTYPANPLPVTSPKQRREHSLWIWTTSEGAAAGVPSFNPSCLKWQAYLKFRQIPHCICPSNNHASPSGSLPFLLPAPTSPDHHPSPVSSAKLHKWISDHQHPTTKPDTPPLRAEAYTTLIDHRIRRAWLSTLYLDDANFAAVATPLYISSASSNPVVRATIAYQLRQAAHTELVKQNEHVSVDDLLTEAGEAFKALDALLKDDEWFFGETSPGLFDASVFAYTHLLLDEGLGWERNELGDLLRRHRNLVAHRDRILGQYFA